MHPGHLSPKQWDARTPTDLHRLLLAACLEPQDAAAEAWREWLARCDFDYEDPASIELAALAVGRLGAAAGDSSEASRCRGWNRRAWYLSEFAVEAAETLRAASDRRGMSVVGVGDLATHMAGYRFSGRAYPVRRVEFEVSGASRSDLEALKRVSLPGSVAEVIRARRLMLTINGASVWSVANTRRVTSSLAIPDAGAHVAWLASKNWRKHPQGCLRWILEILTIVQDAPDPAGLGPGVVAAAGLEGTTGAVKAALRLIRSVPGGEAVSPMLEALENAPVSPFSRIRRLLWWQFGNKSPM
jgi:hypothetical protein